MKILSNPKNLKLPLLSIISDFVLLRYFRPNGIRSSDRKLASQEEGPIHRVFTASSIGNMDSRLPSSAYCLSITKNTQQEAHFLDVGFLFFLAAIQGKYTKIVILRSYLQG
jgi:hypothetical protein